MTNIYPPLTHKFIKQPTRVTSFSIKPADKVGLEELRKLTEHSERTGISFSYLIVQAITDINKKLKLTSEDSKDDNR